MSFFISIFDYENLFIGVKKEVCSLWNMFYVASEKRSENGVVSFLLVILVHIIKNLCVRLVRLENIQGDWITSEKKSSIMDLFLHKYFFFQDGHHKISQVKYRKRNKLNSEFNYNNMGRHTSNVDKNVSDWTKKKTHKLDFYREFVNFYQNCPTCYVGKPKKRFIRFTVFW